MATKKEIEILTLLDGNFQASLDHPTWVNFWKNATKDFQFVEGDQWIAEEIKEIESRGQAPIVENEIKPILDRIIGQYKRQKTRIGVRGRNLGEDEDRSNIITDLMLHAQQNTDYEFEEGDMVYDGNACGFGIFEVKIGFNDLMEAEIDMEANDALSFYPDPNSRAYDWNKDAEFLSRVKWVSVEEAKKLYPSKKKALQAIINLDPVQNETSNFKRDSYFDDKTERVRLVEQWYKTKEMRKRVILSDGSNEDVTDWTEKRIKDHLKANEGSSLVSQVEITMKMGVFSSDVLLEHTDSPYTHKLYPFVPYFIYRKKDGEPYSMVRMLIDPQTEINKRRSKALHLLSTNQIVFEQGSIKDKDELAREMNKPDGQIEYHKKGDAPQILKNVEVATTQITLLAESKQAITRISGVGEDSLNRATEIRSGVGLQRKQAQTDIILLGKIFDNLRRSRKMIGRLMYELIKQYYTEEKAFQITDDLGKAKTFKLTSGDIEIIKEGTYDIIIEEMPDTTTIQDEQFRMTTDILRSLNLPPNYAMAMLPMVIQLSQIRNKDAILEQVAQLSQPPPEHPKISLNLVWSELDKEEKAAFAHLMGQDELAQFELQQGSEAAYKTKEKAGILKEQIKQQDKGTVQ